MRADKFFSEDQKIEILGAIKKAELDTSGEIRLHVERRCKEDILDHAAYLFEKLKMHKTEKRNGVLFYMSIEDRKFAILGDAGINAVTPNNFWDEIKETVIGKFKNGEFTKGISLGIEMTGKALKEHFPYQSDDVNELPDDISFGKN